MAIAKSERGWKGMPMGHVTGTVGLGGHDVLSRLSTALWVYDFEAGRIIWANPAALRLWDAESVAALSARNMRTEMSPSVETRLSQHHEDFRIYPEREIRESWTLYPKDEPFRITAILRRCDLDQGQIGMLVEARIEELSAPETVRSADALLYAQTIIALFDQEGRELYANPAFRATFGPGEHHFGKTFVAPYDLLEFLEGVREKGEHRATVRVRTIAGEAWHDMHAIRCKDAVTGDGAFFINATDVTEARQHQQELAEARDIAERANRMKSQFLRSISHEVRTPLNGILGMACVLGDTELDPAQGEMVSTIVQSGERMLELIENVLELAAIDAGSTEITAERFDPALLVASVVGAFTEAATAKELRILTSVSEVEGQTAQQDAARLRVVLRHLLANAIKFTERGFVSVRASFDEAGSLRFEVADSGIGVPQQQRAQIFDRFYQIDGSLSRQQDGIGVGLAICKETVALLGGEIGVDSEEGRGSIFWITAPQMTQGRIDELTDIRSAWAGHWRVISSES